MDKIPSIKELKEQHIKEMTELVKMLQAEATDRQFDNICEIHKIATLGYASDLSAVYVNYKEESLEVIIDETYVNRDWAAQFGQIISESENREIYSKMQVSVVELPVYAGPMQLMIEWCRHRGATWMWDAEHSGLYKVPVHDIRWHIDRLDVELTSAEELFKDYYPDEVGPNSDHEPWLAIHGVRCALEELRCRE
jgi:hypothetical protein